MSNTDEVSESNGGQTTPGGQTTAVSKEERLATLLLRLLGVYFIAWAIISGTEEAIRLFFAIRTFGLDDALSGRGLYMAHLAVELIIGIYFFVGGQWVVEKVLLPSVHSPLDDGSGDMDRKAPDDASGTDDFPHAQAE